MSQHKIQQVDKFCEMLKRFRIAHERHNPYHVQVQVQHNFYPSKNKYYNSESGKKCRIPDFKDGNDVLMFLGNNISATEKIATFKAPEVVELLEGATDLEGAIKYFKSLYQ